MGYIYKITNKINQKCYIGKTERTIELRWKEHIRHIDTLQRLPLYRALKKYGIENFSIEKIEKCDNLLLDEREIYWIKYYGSYGEKGYNCTGGGEGGLKNYDGHIDEIINRYSQGERLDVLCKEFHYNYNSIKPHLIQKGVIIDTHAGPKKLSKKIIAIDPNTNQIIAEYPSISAASRAICQEGKNPKAIANHISKYKNTDTISHNYLWRTESFLGED